MDITPIPTVPLDSETRTRLIDLSGFSDCVLISPCCACPVCYEDVLPYLTTDNFMFQFNFEITEILTVNLDGTTIADVTGSWKTGTRQMTMKGSEAPECFSVKINGDCCFCFGWQLAADCGDETLLIESTYTDRDCNGNDYTGGYSNAIRIYADMRYVRNGAEVDKDEDNNVTTSKGWNVYGIRFSSVLKERNYPIMHLTNAVLRGFDLTVTETNGTETVFDIFEDSVDSNLQTDFWLPNFELKTKPCEIDYGCED